MNMPSQKNSMKKWKNYFDEFVDIKKIGEEEIKWST